MINIYFCHKEVKYDYTKCFFVFNKSDIRLPSPCNTRSGRIIEKYLLYVIVNQVT